MKSWMFGCPKFRGENVGGESFTGRSGSGCSGGELMRILMASDLFLLTEKREYTDGGGRQSPKYFNICETI
jgi:hypothetical protein